METRGTAAAEGSPSEIPVWKTFDLFNPSEEHKMLRASVASFVAAEVEHQALEFDRKEQFNLPLFRKLGEMGLLGITVPEAYGGSGLDAIAAVIAHEEISASDPGFCLAYLAHSMLFVNNLAVNGSEEQKKRILPQVCAGTHIGAMAMSEPNFGTDVLGMETTAKRDGDFYVINGQKMWITNGCIDEAGTPADFVWVYAKTGEKSGRPQISTFIVEKHMAGYAVGQKIRDKSGMRASNTAELVFTNCRVPVANLVGREGESVSHMMRNLEIERVALAAMSLGIARRSVDAMVKYAKERKAFGKSLASFGQIQRHIAESYAEYHACASYVYDTARRMDLYEHETGETHQEISRLDSDGVKLVTTTAAKNIADRAIQVLGGYGYVGEYVVERLWRDSKLLEIGGGTLEAHQKNITRDLTRD